MTAAGPAGGAGTAPAAAPASAPVAASAGAPATAPAAAAPGTPVPAGGGGTAALAPRMVKPLRRLKPRFLRPDPRMDWRAGVAAARPGGPMDESAPARPGPRAAFRVAWRVPVLLAWTLALVLPYLAAMALGGAPMRWLARLYHAGVCRIIGLRVRVVGRPVTGVPVLFVSNHTSYLDIFALGSVLEAAFVAKAEIGDWPLVGLVSWLGRTVYVSRRRTSTGRERDAIEARLAAGDSLILFPEGTTSDHAHVLPFRSALFAAAEPRATSGGAPRRLVVQPVSLVYDRLDGLPVGRRQAPLFAWFADVALGRHALRALGLGSIGASLTLHEPLHPAAFPSRKALAEAAARLVTAGAAAARMGRPLAPLAMPEAGVPGEDLPEADGQNEAAATPGAAAAAPRRPRD